MIKSNRGQIWVVTGALYGLVALVGCTVQVNGEHGGGGDLPTVDLSGGPAFPLDGHLESEEIASGSMTFKELFDAGSELFHTPYNGLDGVGGFRLPKGGTIHRFSVPPTGSGGGGMLSSQSCGECHNLPFDAGAGLASTNRAGDPDKDGMPPFNTRATSSLWGNGIVQLLAQEITEELQSIRDDAASEAKGSPGTAIKRELTSKGISYGVIVATADASGEVGFDLSGVEGVDPDLVVRPIGWKGNGAIVRNFVVGASAGLMGMQSEELVWQIPDIDTADPDGDGVERELSVGDVTAMTIYNAAQETPQSIERLAELGMVAPPDAETLARIDLGRAAFAKAGCDGCHVPELRLMNTVFEEPTGRGNGHYYDKLTAEKDGGYDLERPVRFDILQDAEPPRAEAHPEGGAIIRSYGDLKRHHMGRHLADPGGPQPSFSANNKPLKWEDEVVMIAPTAFLTPELWGAGSTGPWLHDARAGTLEEAVLLHGEDDPPPVGDPGRSEAQESRDAFVALPADERDSLVVFLRSLRTFAPEED
jgi:hypothetical protein